ncbi:hypothetical protein [Enterobacter kobei]|uniref:hypothetical protein n=1 Tax=Enterobacter kobei TaxID=208224 RepID=UPI00235FAE1F|nr:hypothetical protein [Enterobacter kobei]
MNKIDDFNAMVTACRTRERLESLHDFVCRNVPACERQAFIDLLNKKELTLSRQSFAEMEYLS